MSIETLHDKWPLLSTELAGLREQWRAMAAVLVSAVIFLVTLPFAKIPLAQVAAFIPGYVSVFVICDLIIATLLFGQYRVLRSLPLLILAGAYLFNCLITFAYALVFPGLFTPSGLLGAGPQSSSAIYMFWHSGFPAFVMFYACCNERGSELALTAALTRSNPLASIGAMIVGVAALVIAMTVFATQGQQHIPLFLDVNTTTRTGHLFLSGIGVFGLLALGLLWRKRPHTVLDIWMLVVMSAWLFDLGLSAIFNAGRYDLGWYAGRIYGLLASSSLLIVLLVENTRQYARLIAMSIELENSNRALSELSRLDGLTGLPNRRFFNEYLANQIALATRKQWALALVLCDVDHFKLFNDQYGHQAGDDCLKRVAATLKACCRRPADMAARYGGEEFALILPDTDRAGAIRIAERVRQAVQALEIPHALSSTSAFVSASAGVALLQFAPAMSETELIIAADQALYMAKNAGRNQVAGAPQDAT